MVNIDIHTCPGNRAPIGAWHDDIIVYRNSNNFSSLSPSPSSVVETSSFAPASAAAAISAVRGTRVALLAEWGKGIIQHIRYSPGGTTVATACKQTIWLWRAAHGAMLRRLNTGAGEVTRVAFAPDGTLLAGGFRRRRCLRDWSRASVGFDGTDHMCYSRIVNRLVNLPLPRSLELSLLQTEKRSLSGGNLATV